MSRNKCLHIGVLALLAVSFVTTSGKGSSEQWQVTLAPYAGKGLDDMPVQVIAFDATAHSQSIWVRQWRLLNRSNKTIVKVRPVLFVAKENDLNTLLIV